MEQSTTFVDGRPLKRPSRRSSRLNGRILFVFAILLDFPRLYCLTSRRVPPPSGIGEVPREIRYRPLIPSFSASGALSSVSLSDEIISFLGGGGIPYSRERWRSYGSYSGSDCLACCRSYFRETGGDASDVYVEYEGEALPLYSYRDDLLLTGELSRLAPP